MNRPGFRRDQSDFPDTSLDLQSPVEFFLRKFFELLKGLLMSKIFVDLAPYWDFP